MKEYSTFEILKAIQGGDKVACPVCGTILQTIPESWSKGSCPIVVRCPKNEKHFYVHSEPAQAVRDIREGMRRRLEKPSIGTLEKALGEFSQKGEVESVRCERCGSLIRIIQMNESDLRVECDCGLYNDNLRGL